MTSSNHLALIPLIRSANWDTLGAFDSSVPDDDELDGADPALEELGLALAPKSKKDRKKVPNISKS